MANEIYREMSVMRHQRNHHAFKVPHFVIRDVAHLFNPTFQATEPGIRKLRLIKPLINNVSSFSFEIFPNISLTPSLIAACSHNLQMLVSHFTI